MLALQDGDAHAGFVEGELEHVALLDRAPFPRSVTAGGGRVVWDDAGQTPNVCLVRYDTGAEPLLFVLSNLPAEPGASRGLSLRGVESGYVIQCEGGYYAGGRGKGAAYDNQGEPIRSFRGDSGAGHYRNFVDAVFAHDRSRLKAEVQTGHQSTAWCTLADIAIRVGGSYSHEAALSADHGSEPWSELTGMLEQQLHQNAIDPSVELSLSPRLEFDTETERFVGEQAEAANKLLRREYREAFAVPAVV